MKKAAYTISPLGDSGLIIEFGNTIELEINQRVLALASALQEEAIVGVLDIVPAYSSITLHYNIAKIVRPNSATTSYDALKNKLRQLVSLRIEKFFARGRKLRVPVCYASKYAWDLHDVALYGKMTVDEVVQLHTSCAYRVFMVGFLPGFAYMGEVDERIAMPRKQQPRAAVEAGSVGIAGRQTGIYPLTSPGGWQIIGRTPIKLFDKNIAEPVFFAPGDEVEFFSITEDEFDSY